MKRNVYNFNHIDKKLSDQTVKKYKEWYYYYHRPYPCYQWKFQKSKKIKLILDMSGIGLTLTGTIAGSLTLNPIILGVITGSGVLIQSYTTKSGLGRKVEQCRFAYTSYQKILIQIRGFLRGIDCDESIFLSDLKLSTTLLLIYALALIICLRNTMKNIQSVINNLFYFIPLELDKFIEILIILLSVFLLFVTGILRLFLVSPNISRIFLIRKLRDISRLRSLFN